MIYEVRPADFKPTAEVVGVFCEYQKKILLLHRQNHKSQGGKWGLPAGKSEEGETPEEAVIRELKEETRIEASPSEVEHWRKLFVRYPEYDFGFNMFYLPMRKEKKVELRAEEHSEYLWVIPAEALKMDLIGDLGVCISMFINYRVK